MKTPAIHPHAKDNCSEATPQKYELGANQRDRDNAATLAPWESLDGAGKSVLLRSAQRFDGDEAEPTVILAETFASQARGKKEWDHCHPRQLGKTLSRWVGGAVGL